MNEKEFLITSEINLSSAAVLPKTLLELEKTENFDLKNVKFIRKGLNLKASDMNFKKGERASIDYITTKAADRDDEIIIPEGIDLKHFRKNPVVLFGHNPSDLPIGKSQWIKADDRGLISKTIYAEHEKADAVYNYRKSNFPLAASIGFIPIEWKTKDQFSDLDLDVLGLVKKDIKNARRIYTKVSLLEYSLVPVPSNPEALGIAVSKNLVTPSTLSKEELIRLVDIKFANKKEDIQEKEEKEDIQEKEEKEDIQEKEEDIDISSFKQILDDSIKEVVENFIIKQNILKIDIATLVAEEISFRQGKII